MDDARVLNLLTNINRWWEGEPVPKSITADHKRRDFYVLREKLQQEDGIVTIRGPRQVGKTTVVGQLIESVLERADPRRVLYLNIENSQILSESGDIISKSLELYENNILGVSFQRVRSHGYAALSSGRHATACRRPKSSIIRSAVARADPTTPGMPAPGCVPAPTR